MRMIMGLDRPTSGTVTVNGKPYRQHRAPLREVGALLEASAVHPGRSARSHLRSTNIASRAGHADTNRTWTRVGHRYPPTAGPGQTWPDTHHGR
jgi:ABC-type multidrug transport system ATPase subunit